jgi:hypothetical protein
MPVPVGYSGASAIAMIRDRTGENQLPSDATILTFINAGIEQIVMKIGGIRLYQSYPTVPNTNVITLKNDVQDIISASWSSGTPSSPGTMVYSLEQFDQDTFMDIAGGFPTVGAGPPAAFFVFQDYGTGPLGPTPPPPVPGLSVLTNTPSQGGTFYTMQTYVNGSGETTPSDVSSQYVDTNATVQVGPPPTAQGVTFYNVYASQSQTGPFYKQNASPLALTASLQLPNPLLTGNPPPQSNTAIGYASGGQMTLQLYPPATAGQLNTYYRARPQLWADATASSWTNLDTLAQEAVILWAIQRVLENRSRGDEGVQIFKPQMDDTIEAVKEALGRRQMARTGQVRDVTSTMLARRIS